MPDSLAAVGSWDLLVSPWHLEERIEGFPVPAGAVVLPASGSLRRSFTGGPGPCGGCGALAGLVRSRSDR